ncbi:uncharacterized protein A1O9_09760 [Exophiala aquamarina CBS 119918]|uniref:Uncharacterized protein n=1 Tax=Exophiala aquamarina CBS 119918 TaxID=1182545 RepID=A0A072PEI0_9EURO|nr:uncharacterized protein A1O9_09760 [Exophiala aquamarina CBS 119918]KEF53965.1 hypothetical protein A1O9_09760 [Exophiala aquamarina CBS 119918]
MDQKHPLAAFTALNDRVFIYKPLEKGDPEPVTASQKPSIPDLVVVCAWAFAQPRHIAKYLVHYHSLYPRARILLLFNTVHNMLWRPDWMQMEDLRPAVWAVEECLDSYNSQAKATTTTVNEAGTRADSKQKQEPTVVFHIFSNGGAHMAVQLAQAYRDNIRMSPSLSPNSTAVKKQLPISALIFDSCPGHARYSTAGKTTLSFLPKDAHVTRALAMPLAYAVLGVAYLCHVSGIAEHVVIKLWRELNDPKGPFLFKPVEFISNIHATNNTEVNGVAALTERVIPRIYICSDADDMIPTHDIVEHAAIARRTTGLSDEAARDAVRVEEFVGSMHVNHVSLHKERYWDAVRETLDRIE